jgi:hypothetical protein
MEKTAEKTSTWLALRNPVFRKLWLAMVVSGSCIGAHNTAIYWALIGLLKRPPRIRNHAAQKSESKGWARRNRAPPIISLPQLEGVSGPEISLDEVVRFARKDCDCL